MTIFLMLGWWYGRGWLWTLEQTRERLKIVGRVFAVKVLLKTWFSPWKQIYSPSTFANFFSNAADNAVSRCIGAVVRTGILFAALVLSIFIIIFGLISFIVWPVLPLLPIILPLISLTEAAN